MKLECKLDFSSVTKELQQLEFALQDKLLKGAAEAGGTVLLNGYKSLIPRHDPPGTFKNASQQIEHFQQLFLSVGKKTFLFSDKTGAISIVGVVTADGSRNPAAPQGEWIESGTKERVRTDGQSTGKVEAQHILERTVAEFSTPAQNAAIEYLRQGINSVFTQ